MAVVAAREDKDSHIGQVNVDVIPIIIAATEVTMDLSLIPEEVRSTMKQTAWI